MSTKRTIKLLSILSALGAGVQLSPTGLKAFDNVGAEPNTNSIKVSDVTVAGAQEGQVDTTGFKEGSAIKQKDYGITKDGRVIHVQGGIASVAFIKKNGNGKGQIDLDGYAVGNEQQNNTKTILIDTQPLTAILKIPGVKTADAIDLLGTETFVDKDLYLRTKEGKYLKTLTKTNGDWGDSATTEKENASIRINNAVIKTMPETNKFTIKCTYENLCIQDHKIFYKTENNIHYLVNDKGEYCNWEGKKVEDDKKEAVGTFKNCLQLSDVPSEIVFKFDQGQLATEKGWRKVNRNLAFVAVEVPMEVEKDGKKKKEKKTFLYSPSDGKYLGKNKDLKDKPDLEDEVTDVNLLGWGITKVTAKKVKIMKHVTWTYNVHDKTWKMALTYGGLAGTGAGLLGAGAWGVHRLISNQKSNNSAKNKIATQTTANPNGNRGAF